ncbi:Fruiting body protein SC1 [Psilocybe cubensis]|uniref:Fruiting body protein SC1 n=2 Tax=Psilocybe cubensis TaxID=181762 RepID=A0ACB8GJN1_PSICU|nr:Fruiting body protein SC1 [Psilocybe cubensis]KAH9475250.1 Fruiting body protein SC1 [Psilocybe cubensis]
MFSKVAILAAASMAVFVAAAPTGSSGDIQDSCNTGAVQCCNQSFSSDSSEANLLRTLLGVVLGPVTGQIGLQCTPLSVLAVSGNSCSSQPVCCTDNTFNGLINVGCTPINVNL